MTLLITGGAGFIGSQLARRLLADAFQEPIVIVDNFDSYYDPALKRRNLAPIVDQVTLIEADIRDADAIARVFDQHRITKVVHLAAMSGMRYSAGRGALYADINTTGSVHLLEAAARQGVGIFLLGSTSTVYGETARVPFHEEDAAAAPLAPYPASKRAAELFGHSYHALYGLNTTVLRFFNVYGPYGRPDMMPIRVINSLLHGEPIPIFGGGLLKRDWTYIDDILDGILAALDRPLGYDVINLGCGAPVTLLDFIHILEALTGRTAILQNAPTPPTEASVTYCDNTRARQRLGFSPRVPLPDGLARLWTWVQTQNATG